MEFIINDHSLIPKSDLSDIGTKRTKFNSKRKLADQNNRAFGAELVVLNSQIISITLCLSQFKRVQLSALGQIIKSKAPEEFEQGKFMARKTSDPAIKLKAAMDLYLSGCV